MLAPVLAAGPRAKRGATISPPSWPTASDDLDIEEVGREAKMPWETDGRRWHTRDRVGRNGAACRWDGRILADVIDRVQDSGLLSETNWDNRSVVEIRSAKKSDGWFLHAITAEEWLLKIKFRTARNTFRARRPGRPGWTSSRLTKCPTCRSTAPSRGSSAATSAGRSRRSRSACIATRRSIGRSFGSSSTGRGRLPLVHRPRAAEARGPDALEGPGPPVALPPQGLSQGRAAAMGAGRAGEGLRAAWRGRRRTCDSDGRTR